MTAKGAPVDAERRLYDFTRAAIYLGVSVRKMKELGGPGGQILRVPLGNRVLFDKVDLDAYVERLKRSA